jgi:mRNA-degrading endonuclease toxin of MazEF toxin-antitoxin module
MPVDCVANLDDILTIDKRVLLDQVTTLSPNKMAAVAAAIAFALDLP